MDDGPWTMDLLVARPTRSREVEPTSYDRLSSDLRSQVGTLGYNSPMASALRLAQPTRDLRPLRQRRSQISAQGSHPGGVRSVDDL